MHLGRAWCKYYAPSVPTLLVVFQTCLHVVSVDDGLPIAVGINASINRYMILEYPKCYRLRIFIKQATPLHSLIQSQFPGRVRCRLLVPDFKSPGLRYRLWMSEHRVSIVTFLIVFPSLLMQIERILVVRL